jgi:hypothetical protein
VFNSVDREPDGPWIRVNLALPIGGTEPRLYTPRATLPVVPTISPCASTLEPAALASGAPSGAASAPAGAPRSSARATPEQILPRTLAARGDIPDAGGEPWEALALFLAASALAAWCTQRPGSPPR